ncbi:protocadherin-10-like [Heterodontus francisci]|uniref:protocadherin-10-like n=1 Tax=Heterodontus francisci TaxID=7792 RepID=UPI00355BF074
MSHSDSRWMLRKLAIPSIFLLCVWNVASGQVRYSIPEEQEHGAFIGKIAEDLGLSVEELKRRRFRVVSDSPTQYLDVNLKNGILFVEKRIDREQLCGQSLACFLLLEVVIENPVEQYRAEVEILDINDNSPRFPVREICLEIAESATPGARFLLQGAHDPDVQVNSLRTYQLTANDHFLLDVQVRGETKLPELVLEKTLDREKQFQHKLLLTAIDGGSPERTGTTHVTITVLDINDNAPVFEQSLYTVSLKENVPLGTLVIKLNATDLDEGSNNDIVYSFSNYNKERVRELFSIDPISGEIKINGILDCEEASIHEIDVEAKDRGLYPLATHCNVQVNVKDLNDNAPNITLNSVAKVIREDASTGTLIALINARDKDSHENGRVDCHISPNLPFLLKSSFKNSYRLVSNDLLDRERAPEYKIMIKCKDRGTPPLTTNKTIVVHITDINDNAPRFPLSSYTVYVMENNAPGSSIGAVTAFDADTDQNSHLSYYVQESQMQGAPITSYVSINAENGVIYAQRTFDYEQLKSFQVHIQAQDGGVPLLSNTVTVKVMILDKNDNRPVIIAPGSMNHSKIAVPRSADPRFLVTKIIASDADSGQNARLFYQIVGATEPSLFTVSHNSGEVRTARHFKDSDATTQQLVLQVRDNGHPPLSVTTTVTLTLTEQSAEIRSNFGEPYKDLQHSSDLAFYIVIPLGVISFILLVVIITLVAIIWPVNRYPACSGSFSIAKCCCISEHESKDRFQNSKVNLQIVPDHKMIANILEVQGNGSFSDAYYYRVRSAPRDTTQSMFVTPFSPVTSGTNERNNRTAVSEVNGKVTNDWLDKTNKLQSNRKLEGNFGKEGNSRVCSMEVYRLQWLRNKTEPLEHYLKMQSVITRWQVHISNSNCKPEHKRKRGRNTDTTISYATSILDLYEY